MDDDFTFDNDNFNDANKYKDLLAQIEKADVGTSTVGAKSATIIDDDDGEEVDFDDI